MKVLEAVAVEVAAKVIFSKVARCLTNQSLA